MDTNRDIQALHHILEVFEQAKSNGEEILDHMPGIFCVIDAHGQVFRGNKGLADIFGTDPEKQLHSSFQKLFTAETWNAFRAKIDFLLSQTTPISTVEFDLDLDAVEPARGYVWQLRILRTNGVLDHKLIVVVGSDVTELRKTTSQKARMEMELLTAKSVQETLIPEPNADFGSLKLSGIYQPATECGGDFWFYTKIQDKVLVSIGDVTGHGVSSAMVTSGVRAFFALKEILVQKPPSEIMRMLNDLICETTKFQKCMTLFLGWIDLKTGELTYCTAGHMPTFHIPAGKKLANKKDLDHLISGPTNILGMAAGAHFTDQKIVLNKGDRLFFYTDGLFDIKPSASDEADDNKIYRRIVEALNVAQDPQKNMEHLSNSISTYRGDTELADDVTFFVVQIPN